MVVARVKPDGFKLDHWIENPGKGPRGTVLGSTFTMFVIRVWRHADQLDDTGNLRPFFPRPPGPPNGGNPPRAFMGLVIPYGPILPGAPVAHMGHPAGGPAFYPGFGYSSSLLFPSSPLSSSALSRALLPLRPHLSAGTAALHRWPFHGTKRKCPPNPATVPGARLDVRDHPRPGAHQQA